MTILEKIFKKIIVFVITLEAKVILKKYQPRIIAITGSVGKTSTKDAIYDVLKSRYFVRKSEKSYNSKIGLPLTILGCENAWFNPFKWVKNIMSGLALIVLPSHYPQWLVLEVGLDMPGDIRRAIKLITPDIAVFTKFSSIPVHVENFASPEALFEEKALLISALKQEGLLVLNNDDQRVLDLKQKSKSKIATFGFGEKAMIRASHHEIEFDSNRNPTGILFKVNVDGNAVPVHLSGTLGVQNIYTALAAIGVGHNLKISLIPMVESLATYKTQPGRTKILKGIKDTLIIDDTYNSSPDAVEAALETLSKFPEERRKIVVLGDMLDLGKFAIEEHKRVGSLAGNVANLLLCVGARSQYIAESAQMGLSEKNIFQFNDSKEAGKFLESKLKKGDIILIKGSQTMRMERAVEEIMLHPENKDKLLVRQEPEWQKR